MYGKKSGSKMPVKKPVSKKKGKTRRKSSVNDSAVVAALANMGLTLNTANANLIQSIRNSLK